MMVTELLLVSLALVVPTASVDITPVDQVINLVQNLRNTVATEGSNEAATYNAFSCFCKQTSDAKAASIRNEADEIESLSSRIELTTATRAETKTNVAKRRKDQDMHSVNLTDSKGVCAKQKLEYEATSADLGKALRGLTDAINAMEASKPGLFLEVRHTVQQTLALADSMRLAGAPGRSTLGALLQEHAKVDPSAPEYNYQSQHIIDLLKRLQSEYSDKKSEVEDEWGKTSSACEAVQGAIEAAMAANAQAMVEGERDIESLTGQLATDRESLVQQQGSLKDSQLYTKDLTARCEQRAKDWDQRSQLRGDELKALDEALDILENVVAGNATANVRAMLLQNMPQPPSVMHVTNSVADRRHSPSFLQVEATARVRTGGFLGRARGALSGGARKQKALELLQQEGNRLGSIVLSSLVTHVADDPFKTVKVLIQKLIERLVREAAAEATKEGFCDTELGKSRLDRKYRWEEVDRLLTKIGTLNAKRDKLVEEIAELTTSIKEVKAELANATTLRNQTHVENMETVDKATKGLAGLRDAVAILKAFYKRAANAEVLLLQESPVDADTSGAGFAGAYRGKQESSVAIFGLLEVLESDFERTVRVTTKAEQEDAATFVVFKRDSETNIAGMETKKELNTQDLSITEDSIERGHADLQEQQDLVDKANKALEALKSLCIDSGMSYSERVAKRRQEITALTRALCILDPDHVEDECAADPKRL